MDNVTIKKICKILIITILTICALAIIFFSAVFIFITYLLSKDEGKLNNVEKISEVVIENQETLQDIVSQVLKPEQDLDIVIDIEKKEFMDLAFPKNADEEMFNLENIYCVSEELEIKEIWGYKDSAVDMVIFQTYSSGMVTHSTVRGFLYLERDMTEDIFEEYSYFSWGRSYDYSEITDDWYYFEMSN